MCRIVISWTGLPQYGARLLKTFLDTFGENITVIGTQPTVPIEGMGKALGKEITWVKEGDKGITWAGLGLQVPRILVQSGWSTLPFVILGSEVKAMGGHVIGLADNNYRGDFKQLLGALRFRLYLRNKFDAMLVPGLSGVKLMKFYGMPSERIRMGLYGADSNLFFSNSSILSRPKTFLFVGQFIERKGVISLCNAFLRLNKLYPDWNLRLCGSGILRPEIPDSSKISVENFVQPEQLAEIYREARFFVLPSIKENWGLVVHEAACSGCALLISSAVGSGIDLATKENSIIFEIHNEQAIYNAMKTGAEWDDYQILKAQSVSLENAKKFGPEQFAHSLKNLIEILSRN